MPTLLANNGPQGTELIKRASARERPKAKLHDAVFRATPQNDAHHFRQVVESAKQALTAPQNGPVVASAKLLEAAVRDRQRFWINTCRDVIEMRVASKQVLELHRQHGCRFFAPSPAQVQHILDALDAALPDWDLNHPGLFYQTLELNWPDLLRVKHHASRR